MTETPDTSPRADAKEDSAAVERSGDDIALQAARAARDELVDLIDLEGKRIGTARRHEVRARNLLHRGVGILCFDSGGRIHVHRRTMTKDVFPGLYDMFVGGVVGAGEEPHAAATREIAEELGIRGPEPRWLFDHLCLGPHNRSLVSVYEVDWDGPIVLQEAEISWGGFVELAELRSMLERFTFVPDGLEIWHRACDVHARLAPFREDRP